MSERELTRNERKEIRKLVSEMCANYDREYGCLPLDCPCYMLGKWWTGGYCKYFQNAVLPLNPVLEAGLMGNDILQTEKICPACGIVYIPTTSQAYCSEKCRIRKRRESDRKRKQNNKRKRS